MQSTEKNDVEAPQVVLFNLGVRHHAGLPPQHGLPAAEEMRELEADVVVDGAAAGRGWCAASGCDDNERLEECIVDRPDFTRFREASAEHRGDQG